MHELFATEKNPGGENCIGLIGLHHRVNQIVELKDEGEIISRSTHGVPGIP